MRRGITEGLARAALTMVGMYGLVLGVACSAQRKLLYPAPQPPRAPQGQGELLTTTSPGGRAVFAWWVRGPAGSPALVHFHGNGEQLADATPLAEALRRRGLSVLSVEYPGYGLASDQSPSEEALYDAAEGALGHLRSALGVEPSRTTLLGQSLGSGVAAEMARRGHGARMVLISPYTSIPDVAVRVVPIIPSRSLVLDKFATADKAPGLSLPVLIVHGDRDELIPVSMGRALARAFPRATLEEVPGGHHNDLFAPPGGAALLDTIAAFARE